ncbi:MAG: hypothetical protein FJW38_22585 [Acidobacteria bacterium]|nr:hypothetical protein [Acidobacteriota bacterium]
MCQLFSSSPSSPPAPPLSPNEIPSRSATTPKTSAPSGPPTPLNRGQWRQLENQIRNQRAAHVITGTLYNNCGNERIEAPCYIYKIAYLPDGQILLHFAENARPRP